ncbi:MAG: DUF308 domain-containing protein [Rhodoplanes sp.]
MVLIISGVVQGISLIGAQQVPHFWLQLVSVVLSVIVGAMFVRHPGEGLLTLTLLLIVFFMVEGISKVIFSLTIRPFPNWGLGLGKRHRRDLAGSLSLGQPSRHGDMAAWRIAGDTADLRRCCSRLYGVAGASELIPAGNKALLDRVKPAAKGILSS